jgi:hypothetical protein
MPEMLARGVTFLFHPPVIIPVMPRLRRRHVDRGGRLRKYKLLLRHIGHHRGGGCVYRCCGTHNGAAGFNCRSVIKTDEENPPDHSQQHRDPRQPAPRSRWPEHWWWSNCPTDQNRIADADTAAAAKFCRLRHRLRAARTGLQRNHSKIPYPAALQRQRNICHAAITSNSL